MKRNVRVTHDLYCTDCYCRRVYTVGVCNHVNKGFKTFLTVAPAMILPENKPKMICLRQWEQKSYSPEKNNLLLADDNIA